MFLSVKKCICKIKETTSVSETLSWTYRQHSVSHTCPLSSGCPCHVTDRCGGVFGRFWGVGGGGGCCCFYPRLTPSFCPPDGCQLECSVTGLFLEGAPWNTPTKASLRINTSCSRAVWHVKTWVWFETWVRAGSFSFFFLLKRQVSRFLPRYIIQCLPLWQCRQIFWRYPKILRCLLNIVGQDWGMAGAVCVLIKSSSLFLL